MAENEHNGTEEATPRRREEARQDGQVVQSPDLTAALALLAACGILLTNGHTIAYRLTAAFRAWLTDVPQSDFTHWHVTLGMHWLTSELLTVCTAFVISVMAVSLLTGFLQAGFVISFRPLEADWSRLLPSSGWSRVVSLESGVRGLQAAAKVSLLAAVGMLMVWIQRDQLSARNYVSVAAVAKSAWQLGLATCLVMTGVSLGLALLDYLVKWLRHEQKIRMTREEVKQEQKDDTGDPQIRAAVRKRQREARRRQSVRDVPRATVILTNPTHLAVAVQYQKGMPAPRVVAKGAGAFAKNIVRIAGKHHIPVLERKPLARALYAAVDVGEEIPVEFFRAVAEIIASIYRLKQSG